jgi:hypothetical protein
MEAVDGGWWMVAERDAGYWMLDSRFHLPFAIGNCRLRRLAIDHRRLRRPVRTAQAADPACRTGPMAHPVRVFRITHTTPRRLLGHLRKLTSQGESLLAQPPFLSPADEAPWDARVWKCFDQIADSSAFRSATELDHAEVGTIDLLGFDRPGRSVAELDELLRRRIHRRLVTLASVIEKVEALAELPSRPDKHS